MRSFAASPKTTVPGAATATAPRLILLMVEGALIMARVRRSPAPLRALDKPFKSLLDA